MLAALRRLALVLMLPLALASCGGGTSQVEPFSPKRLVVFGDEYSVITSTGKKYAINALGSDGVTIDCKLFPLWTQVVASVWAFGFAECPVNGNTSGVTRAAPGAKVADVVAQITALYPTGTSAAGDLVLLLVGLNDIVELHGRYPAETEAALSAEAAARGVVIAQQVNRLVDLGAKVIVSTVPDVGLTPWATGKGTADAALVSRLSNTLNGRLRVNILNDGRFVGLVLGDEFVQTAVRAPGVYALSNAVTAACLTTAPLPDCTSATLGTGVSNETWLWANDKFFATGGQRRLGSLAESRARNNPF